MSVEAIENVGPVTVWRKELREGSGGAGQYRGGLGQVVEIAPNAGHEFHFNAMFDRVASVAHGRDGGQDGQAGSVQLDDGTVMRAKGRQFVPAGRHLVLALPGGGGYGSPAAREAGQIASDREHAYVAADAGTADP